MRRRTSAVLGALRPFARQAPRMHPSLVRAPARPHLQPQPHLGASPRHTLLSRVPSGDLRRAHSQGRDSDFYRSNHRRHRVFSGVDVHREADGPGLALARSFSPSSLRSPPASSYPWAPPHSSAARGLLPLSTRTHMCFRFHLPPSAPEGGTRCVHRCLSPLPFLPRSPPIPCFLPRSLLFRSFPSLCRPSCFLSGGFYRS